MPNLLLAQAVGEYIAVWKLVVFLLCFGGWAWLGQWLDKDSASVHINRSLWNSIYVAMGSIVFLIWFTLAANFIVHLLLFLVVWATVFVIYILHRNSHVPKNQAILTPDHFRWLLSNESRQNKKDEQRLVFISVNNNELPIPFRDEPEYQGYINSESFLHDLWKRRVTYSELIPSTQGYQQKYVIDGIASLGDELSREEAEQSISYLKQVAGLDTEDHRRPQTGSFFTIRTGEVLTGWRINTSGSTRGEQLQLERIEEGKIYQLNELGLMPDQIKIVQKAIDQPSGIVLVAGGKGAGISTTLYSLIRKHDAFIQNLHTIEMQPLAELDTITQNIIENNSENSHARQLQTVLRTDPDVVLVGFCDEPEMVQYGIKFAREGKKLYYGFPAPNIFDALQKWMKMAGDAKQSADMLTAVCYQKLIRKLCPDCRQGYTPDATLLKKLNLPVNKINELYRPPPEIEYDRRGNPILCPTCHGTGYLGRTGVFETLWVSDELRELLKQKASANELRAQCRKDKMLYIQEQALRKVIDGTTSIQEVLRITTTPRRSKPSGK